MKNSILLPSRKMTFLDILYSKAFFRLIGFLLIVFPFQLFFAQTLPEHTSKEVSLISLGDGTEIFSFDESFNQQILHGKVKVNKSQISYERESQKLIVKTEMKKSNGKNFSSQVKLAQKKKEEKDLQAVKERIAKFEEKKASFQIMTVHIPFSSNHFFHVKHHTQECAVPNMKVHDFSKINATAYSHILKLSLDNLHSQKYTFYNNRSLDDCYATFFSVRPPPVLV